MSPSEDEAKTGMPMRVSRYFRVRGVNGFRQVESCYLGTTDNFSGLENLRQLAEEKLKVREYGPVYAVFLDGNFEASLILLDGLWNQTLSSLVPCEVAVAVPARDVLAFCDASSSEGLAELKRIVSRVAGGDHLLSSFLYRRQQAKWVPYVA